MILKIKIKLWKNMALQLLKKQSYGISEKPRNPRSTLVSVGCYIYPRSVLSLFSKFLEKSERKKDAPGYFNEWLCKRKEMDCFIFHGNWYDIGDRESYIKANMDYHGKVYIGKILRY